VFFELSGVVPMESAVLLLVAWHLYAAFYSSNQARNTPQPSALCCMLLPAVFFQLSGVVPMESAVPLLKESIRKAYGKKGEKVVMQNCAAVDGAVSALIKIEVPASWANAADAPEGRLGHSHTPAAQAAAQKGVAHFLEEVVKPVLAMEGDRLPVR
jgi:pyruvate-ferredoxin/flavodoxin oxidoreductase